MNVVVATLVVVVALLALLVVGLLRSHAEILRALHDLGVNLDPDAPDGTFSARRPSVSTDTPASVADGLVAPSSGGLTIAHDLAGATPDGGAAVVSLSGRPGLTLVAFLSTGCGTCADFWSAFQRADIDIASQRVRLVIATRGVGSESPSAVNELAPGHAVTIMSDEAFDDHGVAAAPYFLLVDGASGRVIGEGSAASWVQLRTLLTSAAKDSGWAADRQSRRELLSATARRARVDRELADAGIGPGDPSLYPSEPG